MIFKTAMRFRIDPPDRQASGSAINRLMSMEALHSNPRRAFPVRAGLSKNFGGLMKTELALYQALISINVPEQKANAVIEALETDMHSLLATKADLTALRTDLSADLKTEIAQLEVKLTIRMGVMLSAAIGVMIAAMRVML